MDELILAKSEICEVDDSDMVIFIIIYESLQVRMEVDDLFIDLADGRKLLKLLEIISGEKLGKPNNGRMRVHKVENVNKSLAFLHTKVSHYERMFLCTYKKNEKYIYMIYIVKCFIINKGEVGEYRCRRHCRRKSSIDFRIDMDNYLKISNSRNRNRCGK